MDIEICISSDGNVESEVGAAYCGGAARIELCSSMAEDGLTPTPGQISRAREAFPDTPGLMVMIRPRPGNFHYSTEEQDQMTTQIVRTAEVGADGVVFGALSENSNIDMRAVENCVRLSRSLGLKTTFHRAFDAAPQTDRSLDILIDIGVDRVLTSGIAWGQTGSALEGLDRLIRSIRARLATPGFPPLQSSIFYQKSSIEPQHP